MKLQTALPCARAGATRTHCVRRRYRLRRFPWSRVFETIDYPPLLDLPAAYAPETVIADVQAMIALGRANSRMKDFYDIWILTKTFDFASHRLARAIAAPFARRQTAHPSDRPDALTRVADDPLKQRQSAAFVADIDHAP